MVCRYPKRQGPAFLRIGTVSSQNLLTNRLFEKICGSKYGVSLSSWLRVIVWLILCGRTGSRREGSRQSLRLVSCPLQALRPVLGPDRSGTPSFPLAMADEGQWKGMSLPKTRGGRKNNTCIPIRSGRERVLRRRGGGLQGRGESDGQKHARIQDGPNAGIGPLSQPQGTAGTYTHPQILLTRRQIKRRPQTYTPSPDSSDRSRRRH